MTLPARDSTFSFESLHVASPNNLLVDHISIHS